MNKIRLYQILSVLLLPYREQTFLKNDPIAKLRYAFEELKRHRMAHDFNSTYRTQYDEAERELGLFLRDRKELYIHTLDDFRLLLEMFFSEKKHFRASAQGSHEKPAAGVSRGKQRSKGAGGVFAVRRKEALLPLV